ncbi:MAG TPA: PEGA domain-containing protein [Thermoanaerobaculia bacterium]|nr:PEGA domain-containing protein [Thermoanaerobaculia bacterium]
MNPTERPAAGAAGASVVALLAVLLFAGPALAAPGAVRTRGGSSAEKVAGKSTASKSTSSKSTASRSGSRSAARVDAGRSRGGSAPTVIEKDRRTVRRGGSLRAPAYWGHYPWGYGWWGGVYGSWWGVWSPLTVVVAADGYPGYPQRGMGALDTDVHPEEAEVWVDGERVGIADHFDGWPSYLWLPTGTYDVVFYHPGYRTLARQYSIYDGVVIDVEDRMERGEAVHPRDLASTSTVRRDARIERDRRQRQSVERLRRDDDWRRRERVVTPQATAPEVEEEDLFDDADPYQAQPSEGAVVTVRPDGGDEGRLFLRVEPLDASVYLDGRFVGTGRELGMLQEGLLLDPGDHSLEVVRPGYEPESLRFDAASGEDVELRVTLERD